MTYRPPPIALMLILLGFSSPFFLACGHKGAAGDRLVPKPVPGIMGTSSYFGDYYEKVLGQERLASFNLKSDFAYGHLGYTEAHNFINGRRSILDIYRATTSELWSEQYPPAHAISLREVADYMKMLEAAKVITLEKKAAAKS
jgi:hypothetical protein